MAESEIESTRPSRRTIVKVAAWSVPVIAASIATPLAAASVPPVLQAEFIARAVDTTPNTWVGSWEPTNPEAEGPAVYAGEAITQTGTIQNVGSGAGTLAANGAQVTAGFVSASPSGGRVFWSEPVLSAASIAAGWSIVSRTNANVLLTYANVLAPNEVSPPYELIAVAQDLGPGVFSPLTLQSVRVLDPLRPTPTTTIVDRNGRPGVVFSPRP